MEPRQATSSAPSIFSLNERVKFLKKVNCEFGARTISKVSNKDIDTLRSATVGRFLEACLTLVTAFWKNQSFLSLLRESREATFLLKIYKKLSKIDLAKEAPEGVHLLSTVPGRAHQWASTLLVKSLRQSSKIHQLDDIDSDKMEMADVSIGNALTSCFKTIAHVAQIPIKDKNRLSYLRQLFQELEQITDANGKNVVQQIQHVLTEKKDLYHDLSALYHAQWCLETGSLEEEQGRVLVQTIAGRHKHEIDPALPLGEQIAALTQVLEGKTEKIDKFFRSRMNIITDQLSIYETTTDRLAQKFTDKVLEKPIHVTMVGVEYSGFIKEGGLAEALQGLSVAMKKQHPENVVRLIFPHFNILPKGVRDELALVPRKEYRDSFGEQFFVRTLIKDGVECYFVEDPLFQLEGEKPSIYGPQEGPEMKNRYARFSQLVSDLIPQLGKTDVIHLHDWQVAGVALKYKKDHLQEWEEGKTPSIVFTFHNNSRGAQGRYYSQVYNYEGTMQGLIRAGIASDTTNTFVDTLQIADSATTVSPTFAIECQNVDSGEGVSFATREAAEQGKLFGVINGSNPASWDPSKDRLLQEWKDPETNEPINLTFSPDSSDILQQKRKCKEQLAKWIVKTFPNGPSFVPEKPIVTYVGRFDSYQKGLDKLDEAIAATLGAGGQFVCMGSLEDSGATRILDRLQEKYAGKPVAFIRDYKDSSGRYHYQQGGEGRQGIGSVVRAASEFICVPSRYEPCGLVQFEGWLFGSLAIGSRVGGLADTIIPPEKSITHCNGFLFERDGRSETSIGAVVHRALDFWAKIPPEKKKDLVSRIMNDGRKCSWSEAPRGYSPVEKYRFVYENARNVAALRALSKKVGRGRQLDLLKFFKTVSSQSPSNKTNILEERYLSLYKHPSSNFAKLERAYLALDPGLRMQVPSPYTTDVDFHMHVRYGAHFSKDSTHFEVPAPNAKIVLLKILDQNVTYPMSKLDDGSWAIDVQNLPAGTKYQYVVNGMVKIDPYGRGTEPTEIGQAPCSVVQDPQKYHWGDDQWLAHRINQAGKSMPMSIFEVYPGAWRKPKGKTLSYKELAPMLVKHCKAAGYTHVELMGILDHPSESSWGYQVSSFFAPNGRMGSPDDLKYLIDVLHKNNIGVVMDFVPFHFSIDDYALNKFDGTNQFQPSKAALAFSVAHTFFRWGTKLFDYTKKSVRDFLVSSAAFWVEEMHVDLLRVDAVHPILCSKNVDSAKLFLKELNAVIHTSFPGVQTIAEDYSGEMSVTRPFYQEGLGFDMKWNIAWMKHALDFFAIPPQKRGEAYPGIVKAVESDCAHKMIMAISHDEVKKESHPLLKMTPGLTPEQELANLRSFLGMMYSVPGKKLLFMGCDTGSEEHWDKLIGKSTGVDDRKGIESKEKIALMVRDLNEMYKQPAFHDKDYNGRDVEWIEKNDPNGRIVAFRRISSDKQQSFACVHNFTDKGESSFVINLRVPIPSGQPVPVIEVFNSEDKKYAGSGLTNTNIEIVKDDAGNACAYKIHVPPMTSLIIREP